MLLLIVISWTISRNNLRSEVSLLLVCQNVIHTYIRIEHIVQAANTLIH